MQAQIEGEPSLEVYDFIWFMDRTLPNVLWCTHPQGHNHDPVVSATVEAVIAAIEFKRYKTMPRGTKE